MEADSRHFKLLKEESKANDDMVQQLQQVILQLQRNLHFVGKEKAELVHMQAASARKADNLIKQRDALV